MIARLFTTIADMDMVGRYLRFAPARAGRASHRALFHSLGHSAPIAIALGSSLYFAGQLVRGSL